MNEDKYWSLPILHQTLGTKVHMAIGHMPEHLVIEQVDGQTLPAGWDAPKGPAAHTVSVDFLLNTGMVD
jgi:hypothetical protein